MSFRFGLTPGFEIIERDECGEQRGLRVRI